MQATNPFAGYKAQVVFRGSDSQSVFKVQGWCWSISLHGKPVSAGGNCRSEQAARQEAVKAVRWHALREE